MTSGGIRGQSLPGRGGDCLRCGIKKPRRRSVLFNRSTANADSPGRTSSACVLAPPFATKDASSQNPAFRSRLAPLLRLQTTASVPLKSSPLQSPILPTDLAPEFSQYHAAESVSAPSAATADVGHVALRTTDTFISPVRSRSKPGSSISSFKPSRTLRHILRRQASLPKTREFASFPHSPVHSCFRHGLLPGPPGSGHPPKGSVASPTIHPDAV